MDNRDKLLASNLVNYSCEIKAKEKVLIEFPTEAKDLVKEIIKMEHIHFCI